MYGSAESKAGLGGDGKTSSAMALAKNTAATAPADTEVRRSEVGFEQVIVLCFLDRGDPLLTGFSPRFASRRFQVEKQTNYSPRGGGGTVNMLPDSMQYRHMKAGYHQRTYVRNSPIHSLGLFANNRYAAQEMVIEYTGARSSARVARSPVYIGSAVATVEQRGLSQCPCLAGEIIRQKLADKREHIYLQKGIACYLFALDGELVIDSSMKGNSARFINHCCDVRTRLTIDRFCFTSPCHTHKTNLRSMHRLTGRAAAAFCLPQPNCTARVMNLEGSRRIIFSTVREIEKDEELTYDYKFCPESDPALKVPCSCGAVSCRGWLN
eukprot:COSAG06_NODE_1041_length_10982_cov_6.205366_10_plen_324_part_00